MRSLSKPFDTLVSFHYFGGNQEPWVRRLAAAGCRTIGDSGAYSAMSLGKPVDLDQFAEWAERNRPYLAWTASLDAIGDPDRTWKNYRYLTRNGLDVVPTVHFPAPPTALDRYAELGVDFIGLGGVAARKDRAVVLKWLVAMFRHARDHHPQMRFHGWGLTARVYLTHLPFYSVDSSGFGAGYRYGNVSVWDSTLGKNVSFHLDSKDASRHWELLRRTYGASATDFADSTAANRALHVRLTSLSAQEMGLYYQRRHNVTPPKNDALTGTRIHVADTSGGNFGDALEITDTRGHFVDDLNQETKQ